LSFLGSVKPSREKRRILSPLSASVPVSWATVRAGAAEGSGADRPAIALGSSTLFSLATGGGVGATDGIQPSQSRDMQSWYI
jgi:hypothetical protein